jgi:lipocalin
MMNTLKLSLAFVLLLSMGAEAQTCKEVKTVSNFNITTYASKPWYSHQQAETRYSPSTQNYCTRAIYTVRKSPTVPWGYTVGVNNYAEDSLGNQYGGPLCAYQKSGAPSKLAVGPCFLPKFVAGPYWVVAYDETKGYALISGGQPKIQGTDGCKTGTGTNNSGLWIFLRSKVRDDELIDDVRDIAKTAGFDITVLKDVVHEDCDYGEVVTPTCKDQAGTFPVLIWGQKDCDWVDKFRLVRCALYGDKCPDTCNKC